VRMQGAGFRVQGSGFRVQPPALMVKGFKGWGWGVMIAWRELSVRMRCWRSSSSLIQGLGFEGVGLMVSGSGFRVQGSGLKVQRSGFRV